MSSWENVVLFPDYYPLNFESKLKEVGAKQQQLDLYRIAKYGVNDSQVFISTYEEVLRGLAFRLNKEEWLEDNKCDIDSLSTSFFMDKKDIIGLLKCTLKNKPKAVILYGEILEVDGYSQLTKERKPNKKDSHVDVWFFKDAKPQKNFSIEGE